MLRCESQGRSDTHGSGYAAEQGGGAEAAAQQFQVEDVEQFVAGVGAAQFDVERLRPGRP
ncbi:hypothetical protein Acsp04_51020 [Actinomadura sp. NBRC 104425]|nr:hypothetical protein Acsp04_51020 [Actinomadura sp. NBRC 104425]